AHRLHLGSQRLAKSLQAPLGSVVETEEWHGAYAARRGDLHDVTVPVASHDGQCSLGHPHRTEQVDVQDGASLRLANFLDGSHQSIASVVHQNVQTSGDATSLLHSVSASLPVCGSEPGHGEAWILDGQGFLPGSGHHVMTSGQRLLGQSEPEAAARTCDEPGLRCSHPTILHQTRRYVSFLYWGHGQTRDRQACARRSHGPC